MKTGVLERLFNSFMINRPLMRRQPLALNQLNIRPTQEMKQLQPLSRLEITLRVFTCY